MRAIALAAVMSVPPALPPPPLFAMDPLHCICDMMCHHAMRLSSASAIGKVARMWWLLRRLRPLHDLLEPVIRMLKMIGEFWSYSGVGTARHLYATSAEHQRFQQGMLQHSPHKVVHMVRLRLALARAAPQGDDLPDWLPTLAGTQWNMIEKHINHAMSSTDRRSPSGWDNNAVLSNNIVIDMLQGANGRNFLDVQQYELDGSLRDTLASAEMMALLAQCSRRWNEALRDHLQRLRSTTLALRDARKTLPCRMSWPASWQTLASDMARL